MILLIKKTRIYLSIAILTVSQLSCNSDNNSLESELPKTNNSQTTTEISSEEINELLESFPSSLEMALVIKNEHKEFSSYRLLNTENSDRFSGSYNKAMAIGAYGSDMGYANIYEKVFLMSDYLGTIRSLSADVDLDNFFNFEKMIDMSKNVNNIDSLIRMSTESFNAMEAHLREKGRDELSVMMVFGMWLEGAYIIADITKESPSEQMIKRVAEQKIFVEKINKIFGSSQDESFIALSKKTKTLGDLYDQVQIETIMKEPTMEEIDGQLVFIDNNETIINASDSVIESIISELIKIRNELLN